MIAACTGGWCLKRESCAHYFSEQPNPEDRRLCKPGMDGVKTEMMVLIDVPNVLQDPRRAHWRPAYETLVRAGVAGASSAEISAATGMAASAISDIMGKLRRYGLVFTKRIGLRGRRWFVAYLLPEVYRSIEATKAANAAAASVQLRIKRKAEMAAKSVIKQRAGHHCCVDVLLTPARGRWLAVYRMIVDKHGCGTVRNSDVRALLSCSSDSASNVLRGLREIGVLVSSSMAGKDTSWILAPSDNPLLTAERSRISRLSHGKPLCDQEAACEDDDAFSSDDILFECRIFSSAASTPLGFKPVGRSIFDFGELPLVIEVTDKQRGPQHRGAREPA